MSEFVRVPKEPTEAMLRAMQREAIHILERGDFSAGGDELAFMAHMAYYKAALAAAPTAPPASPGPEPLTEEMVRRFVEMSEAQFRSVPYFDAGKWRIPYLVSGTPMGGGVGEYLFDTFAEAMTHAIADYRNQCAQGKEEDRG